MKILVIGDVTSTGGIAHLEKNLWKFRSSESIDLCIVNAENAGFITGADAQAAERILSAGADCLTGGNHTLRNHSVYGYLDESSTMLRPINFGDAAPGAGYTVLDVSGYRVLIISAMGNVGITPTLDSPFGYIDRLLEREAGGYDIAVLDIHAEATGEKLAIAHTYDGKINVIFGTHTHVPTADEQILPHGSGYITDVGMCGESGGILGMDVDSTVLRMRTHLTPRFTPASGAVIANGAIFTVDPTSGKVNEVRRVKF